MKINYEKAYKKAKEIYSWLDVLIFEDQFVAPKHEVEQWKFCKKYIEAILDAGEEEENGNE